MIQYDATEGMGGFTASSLLAIEQLLGRDIAILLYGEVVPIDVEPSGATL